MTLSELSNYTSQPLTHQVLMSMLKEYKRPNDKIHELLKSGDLSSIKKGLYVAGPALYGSKPEPFLLANHILGPSYVSADAALSWHGLIPERVYEITSMTTKPAKKFSTPMGLFSYIHLPLPYYSFGISQLQLTENQNCMIASPEKAVCDKVVTTAGLILRNPKGILEYLQENLRIDVQSLKTLDVTQIESWLPSAPKKQSIEMILKTLKSL